MKKILIVLFTFVSTLFLCAQQKDVAHITSDETAVKTVVESFLTAAGDYDIDAMPSLFSEHASIGGVTLKNGKWTSYTMSLEAFMDILRVDENPAKYTDPVSKYSLQELLSR
jgi:hypothetical protein